MAVPPLASDTFLLSLRQRRALIHILVRSCVPRREDSMKRKQGKKALPNVYLPQKGLAVLLLLLLLSDLRDLPTRAQERGHAPASVCSSSTGRLAETLGGIGVNYGFALLIKEDTFYILSEKRLLNLESPPSQKRYFLGALTYVTSNCYTPKRSPAACDARYFSAKEPDKALSGKIEIYYGTLTKQIRALKAFSLMTSAGGLLAQPVLYLKAMESGNTGVVLGIFACIGFMAVTTPLLIHMITKKYVTHLYYDEKEDKYTAYTYSLFLRTKELTFTPGDVRVPDITGMFTNCIVKDTPLFLEQKFFNDSSHYIRIMGYDKPIDFKLGNNNQTITVNTEYKDDSNKK